MTAVITAMLARTLLLCLTFNLRLTLCQRSTTKGPKIRGEFITCPGCRLNHLPELKQFLRQDIEKGAYINVTVTYIPGRNPELYLFTENDQEQEHMYVDKLKYTELHDLMSLYGFKKNPNFKAQQ